MVEWYASPIRGAHLATCEAGDDSSSAAAARLAVARTRKETNIYAPRSLGRYCTCRIQRDGHVGDVQSTIASRKMENTAGVYAADAGVRHALYTLATRVYLG